VTGFLIKHPSCLVGYISLNASRFISPEDMKQTLTLILQVYQGLSNTTIPRKPGLKFEYSTFGSVLLSNVLTLKLKYYLYKMLEEVRLLRLLQRVCPPTIMKH
jgi:hypothetical protein